MIRNALLRPVLGRLLAGGGARAQLLLALLPLALRWIARNGGLGAVLQRFRQQGYGRQAQSWVARGDNARLDEHAIHEVVGQEELARLALHTGVPPHEVAEGFAQILPQVVDRLSPQGELPAQADAVLEDGRQELERELAAQGEPQAPA